MFKSACLNYFSSSGFDSCCFRCCCRCRSLLLSLSRAEPLLDEGAAAAAAVVVVVAAVAVGTAEVVLWSQR